MSGKDNYCALGFDVKHQTDGGARYVRSTKEASVKLGQLGLLREYKVSTSKNHVVSKIPADFSSFQRHVPLKISQR